mmetsp:Transcript_11200/g.27229  ORF Transcript_11200/g.27229 Transcript_11200/m.27229 type:complete len:255 (+) Transcript_11200:1017-1781(+)
MVWTHSDASCLVHEERPRTIAVLSQSCSPFTNTWNRASPLRLGTKTMLNVPDRSRKMRASVPASAHPSTSMVTGDLSEGARFPNSSRRMPEMMYGKCTRHSSRLVTSEVFAVARAGRTSREATRIERSFTWRRNCERGFAVKILNVTLYFPLPCSVPLTLLHATDSVELPSMMVSEMWDSRPSRPFLKESRSVIPSENGSPATTDGGTPSTRQASGWRPSGVNVSVVSCRSWPSSSRLRLATTACSVVITTWWV